MLTDHIKLCAQYGVDVTHMTQVEAYAALVERLLMKKRIEQFQFCIDRVAEALGNVCCGGVDSSPDDQLADPHSTTRVLVDAVEKLKVRANDAYVRGYTKAMDEKDFVESLKNRDGL